MFIFLKTDNGDRETQAKFYPRDCPVLLEIIKAIMGLNVDLFKNIPKSEWTAAAFLARVKASKAGLPLPMPRADVDEATIEEVDDEETAKK